MICKLSLTLELSTPLETFRHMAKFLLSKTFPALMYSWVFSTNNFKLLTTFKRRILRRIIGVATADERFCSLYNKKNYERYRDHGIVDKICLDRVGWYCHLICKGMIQPGKFTYIYKWVLTTC